LTSVRFGEPLRSLRPSPSRPPLPAAATRGPLAPTPPVPPELLPARPAPAGALLPLALNPQALLAVAPLPVALWAPPLMRARPAQATPEASAALSARLVARACLLATREHRVRRAAWAGALERRLALPASQVPAAPRVAATASAAVHRGRRTSAACASTRTPGARRPCWTVRSAFSAAPSAAPAVTATTGSRLAARAAVAFNVSGKPSAWRSRTSARVVARAKQMGRVAFAGERVTRAAKTPRRCRPCRVRGARLAPRVSPTWSRRSSRARRAGRRVSSAAPTPRTRFRSGTATRLSTATPGKGCRTAAA
jgi:hypothetical protein